MASDRLIRYLREKYADSGDGVSDAELLGRCADSKDDAAFELLMRRHADLVCRVCRAVAGDYHTAEDAFQATFLALARSPPRSVPGSVAGWLYRVAYHAALKARPRGDEADTHADILTAFPAPPEPHVPEQMELAVMLHQELERLDEAYRLPLVLYYIEGYSQVEAAKALGCPVGTVATRVSRGREKLRDRLPRRGFAMSVGGLVAAFGGEATATPTALVSTTARVIGT